MLNNFSDCKILVVGDAMLDRYWFGDSERISPEAPVPIVRILKSEERLGGAANVAHNIATVGANAILLSNVGDDVAGHSIEKMLKNNGIISKLQFTSNFNTIIKLRIVARNQQLLRCDFEDVPNTNVLKQQMNAFNDLLIDLDAIVFSDYGKGGLSHIKDMIQLARKKKIPILGNSSERHLRRRSKDCDSKNVATPCFQARDERRKHPQITQKFRGVQEK